MSKIKVTSKCKIYDGMSITFKAPCDCTAVDGLNVHYQGTTHSFSLRDAHGNNLARVSNLFTAGTYVKVILDTASGIAYIQNADSNAYLENRLDAILSDETKALYGLDISAVPNDVFAIIHTTIKNIGRMTNGPFVITKSQTLDMSQYGLKVGDQLNVICIGGGGGGGGSYKASGGAAGKGGGTVSGSTSIGAAGGGGGGYGGGGGGAAGGVGTSNYSYAGGGGGGSGHISAATVTLNSTSIPVTIGAGGSGGAQYKDGSSGGTTSFGALLSATGGSGGTKGDQVKSNKAYPAGGAGGHRGGNGAGELDTYGSGGGGGGGWTITDFLNHSGTDGETGYSAAYTLMTGGTGGTNGGKGSAGRGTPGSDAPANSTNTGHGVVIFWY